MTVITSIETKAASVNSEADLFDDGSEIEIYAGTPPATTATAITGQTLLSTHAMASTPFATTSTAVATANAIGSATAAATGTAAFYRALDSTGKCHRQGSVGTSGTDLIVANTSFLAGATINITGYTITQS